MTIPSQAQAPFDGGETGHFGGGGYHLGDILRSTTPPGLDKTGDTMFVVLV